jgi:hypothetical protein
LIGSSAAKQLIANAASRAACYPDRDVVGAAACSNEVAIGIAEVDVIACGIGKGQLGDVL